MSAFSCIIGFFATEYKLTLALVVAIGLRNAFPENGLVYALLASLGVAGAEILGALFGAKGKLWCYLIAAGVYLADLVYAFFLFDPNDAVRSALLIIIHVVFLALYAVGFVFYVKADRYLQAHAKEIMRKQG